MQTTVCAYCDHEVKITPDGVCLFCGGNLADKPINEIDEKFLSRMERVRNLIIGEPIPTKYLPFYPKEIEQIDRFRKTFDESEAIKELVKPFQENWIQRNWLPAMFGIMLGGGILLVYLIIFVNPLYTSIDLSPILSLLMAVIPICFILIIVKKLGREL